MALRILYPGVRNSLATLAAAAFTRQNFGLAGMSSSRITADTPDGALGGMVAKYSGNYEVDISNNYTVAGIFINDAAGSPFENTPAVASGKCPMMTARGSYETDIYETRNELNTLDLAYAAGNKLYVSQFGLITKDTTGGVDALLGVCSKAPSATDPWLGFDLKI